MRGITIISLVVTIIILLILAGLTITMLTGENGILTQTRLAKKKTKISSEKEAIEMANNIAKELGHNYVGTEHILYGLSKAEIRIIEKSNRN